MIVQDQIVGTRFEKCVVESLIGRGGYGLSFLAFDEELKEHRVIKISQDTGLDESMRRRHLKNFLDEGLILSRLKHPQIVTLRGQGEKNGQRYMILDYIRGFNLKNILDIVQQRQQELGCLWQDLLTPETATALVLSALYPLEYAHRANVHLPDREIFGVAHRDISPGNLILGVQGNEKGRIVLIDFGTAKTDLTESITIDQNLVGTVPYMSKARLQKTSSTEEMALNQDFWMRFRETQHDIHALGVLYFQLLTGRLPFAGETSPQIIVKILDPLFYSQAHGEIANSFPFASDILQKCLVYHDFTASIKDQPYQYPDAGSMLPDMVAVFDKFSSGHSAQEILVELGNKLARPELFSPVQTTQSFAFPITTKMQETRLTPIPRRRSLSFYSIKPATRITLYAVGLVGLLALAVWVSGAFNSKPKVSSMETHSTLPAVLENLGAATDSSKDSLQGHTRDRAAHEVTIPPEKKPKDSKPEKLQSQMVQPGQKPKTYAQAAPALSSTHQGSPNIENTAKLDKAIFGQLQNGVREQDPAANEQVLYWLQKYPESPDLRLLKIQSTLALNPLNEEIRPLLLQLQNLQPEFTLPSLYNQTVQYLLFELDAALYRAQKTPARRINMQKSANAYLSEYQENPAFAAKVRRIQELLAR